jgi:hypothetical protein
MSDATPPDIKPAPVVIPPTPPPAPAAPRTSPVVFDDLQAARTKFYGLRASGADANALQSQYKAIGTLESEFAAVKAAEFKTQK